MGILEDLANEYVGKATGKSQKKKSAKKKFVSTGDIADSVLDNIDDALKSKLPKSPVTDIAENALDQNKDGRVVDDLLRAGKNLLNKKK